MEGKPIEEGKISQKDLTRGKPTEGIRKGECLLKMGGWQQKGGMRKKRLRKREQK